MVIVYCVFKVYYSVFYVVRFLQDWVFHGVHRDLYGEFMIQMDENYLDCRGNNQSSHGTSHNNKQTKKIQMYSFIALIHPIQWTIANPVGADRPAKRQKKTSCVSTSWPVPVLCIRQVAHGIYFLSRQHDVIASFCLARVLCRRVFNISRYFKEKCAL